ncbi:MAG: HalOD1 output domain-containing protein [Halobacteriaceae archaeon]
MSPPTAPDAGVDDGTAVRATFDAADGDAPTVAVARALGRAIGVGPTDVDPLGRTLDAAALDALFAPGAQCRREVTFVHAGHRVTLRSESGAGGDVVVRPVAEE